VTGLAGALAWCTTTTFLIHCFHPLSADNKLLLPISLTKELAMFAIRCATAVVITVALGSLLTAADKEDNKDFAKKIVGKWSPAKDRDKTVLDFAKDGTIKISMPSKEDKTKPAVIASGKYSIKGDQMTVTLKFKGKDDEKESVLKIVKLTDDTLITSEKEGKQDEFKREK
jgi:uncharacterized protein (TIGR03066 family)